MNVQKITQVLIVFFICVSFQVTAQEDRIEQLKIKLESIIVDAPGLAQKAEINVNNVALSDFLQAIATTNKININIHPELNEITIKNNFSNATVTDVLIFVCKEFELDIDFTGNILSIHKFIKTKPIIKHRGIPITYDLNSDIFSIELQQDTLHAAFKQIMDKTGKNLVFAPGMDKLLLSGYIQKMPFDAALDKIAFANNISFVKTRDHFYLFEQNEGITLLPKEPNLTKKNVVKAPTSRKRRRSNFYFKITDTLANRLDVDFENTPIANIAYDIGHAFDKNMFTASPLNQAGNATVKATNITYDLLLDKILENTEYTYKKADSMY